jgi:hypothetical protein
MYIKADVILIYVTRAEVLCKVCTGVISHSALDPYVPRYVHT